MKYREVNKGEYLIRMDKGEEVVESLRSFCKEHKITSGVFSGIGGVINASIGNYNSALHQYMTKTYKNMLEVGHFNGNISIQDYDDKVAIHAHMTGSNDTDGVVVGHLFGALVEVTMEIHLRSFPEKMIRKLDPETEYRIWEP